MGSSSVVIGYKYYLGLQFALCQGSATEIHAIYTNDTKKVILANGNYVDGSDPFIDKEDLFGGRKKGGGIVGQLRFQFGAVGQTSLNYLNNKISIDAGLPAGLGVVPCVGLTTVTAERPYICSMNPTMRPWEFRMYRRSERVSAITVSESEVVAEGMASATDGFDANPGAVLDECLFDKSWGLGLALEDVNLTTFSAVATTLKAEGVGLSLRLASSISVKKFIREVLTHINGVLYTEPASGKLAINIMRDTDTSSITLDSNNIDSFVSYERTAWSATINEIVVEYTDKINYDKASLSVHNSANLDIQGGHVSKTVVYKGIRSQGLAAKTGARDLKLLSFPLTKCVIIINKEGWNLQVGAVAEVTWEEYDLATVRFRILDIDYGDFETTKVRLTLLQDTVQDYTGLTQVFGMGTGAIVSDWTSIDSQVALASTLYRAVPAPYYFLFNALSDADFPYYDLALDTFYILSETPTGDTTSFRLNDNAGEISPEVPVSLIFDLAADTYLGDSPTDTIVTIVLSAHDGFEPTPDQITDIVASSDAVLIIGEEILIITNFVDNGDLTYTLTCPRSGFDTVTQYHVSAAGETAFVLDSAVNVQRSYGNLNNIAIANGVTSNYRLQTRTFSDLLSYADSPTIGLTGKARADRPQSPKRPEVAYSSTQMTISWVYDDKTLTVGTPPSALNYSSSAESGDIRTTITAKAHDGTVILNTTVTGASITLNKTVEEGLTIDGKVSPDVFVEIHCFYNSSSLESLQRIKIQSFRRDVYMDAFEDHIAQIGNALDFTHTDPTVAKQYKYVCADRSFVLITGAGNDATIYVCNENGGVSSTISGGNCNGMLTSGTPDHIDISGAAATSAKVVWTQDGTNFKVATVATVDITIDNSFTIADGGFTSATQVLMDSTYIYITDNAQTHTGTTATGALHRTLLTGGSQTKIQPDLENDYTVLTGTPIWAYRVTKTWTADNVICMSQDLHLNAGVAHTNMLQRLTPSTSTLVETLFTALGRVGLPNVIVDMVAGESGVAFTVLDTQYYTYYLANGASVPGWEYAHAVGRTMTPASVTGGIDNVNTKLAADATYVYFVYSDQVCDDIVAQNHRPYYNVTDLYPNNDGTAAKEGTGEFNKEGMHYYGTLNRILISSGALNSSDWSHDNPYFVIAVNGDEVVGNGYAPDVMERILGLNDAGTRILMDTSITRRQYWITTQ